MTARDLFEQHLPAALAKRAEEAKAIGGSYHFNVTGDGGGRWRVDLRRLAVEFYEYDDESADVRLTITAPDFAALLADPSQGMIFYFTSRLKIEGDVMAATRLPRLFALLKD